MSDNAIRKHMVIKKRAFNNSGICVYPVWCNFMQEEKYLIKDYIKDYIKYQRLKIINI